MICYIDTLHALCAATTREQGRRIQNERLQNTLDKQLKAQLSLNKKNLGSQQVSAAPRRAARNDLVLARSL